MPINTFTFNGVNSAAKGLRIRAQQTFNAPKYDNRTITVPGRDGLLMQPNGRFENLTVAYEVFLVASDLADMRTKVAAVESWLLSAPEGYHELTDTYNTGMLRRATFYGPLDVGVTLKKLGTATLSFSCYPFRFDAATYSTASTVASGGTLTNPYAFASKPIISLTHSGNTTGEKTFTIANDTGTKTWTVNFGETGAYTVVIDSENMTVTKVAGNTKTNYSANLAGDGFPELAPGVNTITCGTGVSEVKVTPRWRTL